MNKLKTILIFIIILATSIIESKVIIWDLGGTLLKPNQAIATRKIGYMNSIKLFLKNKSETKKIINQTLFKTLETNCNTTCQNNPYEAFCPMGLMKLPIKFCEWLAGKCSCRNIRHTALQNIKKMNFSCNTQKKATKNLINWMFEPKEFARGMKIDRKIFAILKECTRQKEKHELYILSNWNKESFKYFYKDPRNKKLFKYFKPENIFISGEIKDIKPNPSTFKYVINKKRLNPKECIFIDDQKENLDSAKELGFKVIHVKKNNHKEIREQLKKYKVLS